MLRPHLRPKTALSLAALLFAALMVGAIMTVTGQRDFVYLNYIARDLPAYRFMQVGYEYNFAIIVMALTLIILGSGRWSLDHYIFSWWKTAAPAPALVPGAHGPVPPAVPVAGSRE